MMFPGFLPSALSQGHLSVFLFHKVPSQVDPLVSELCLAKFERLLDHTLRSFKVLPLNEAVSRLAAGTLPRMAACITFDDGYADWMTGVVPALASRDLHATFFITTGQFDGAPLWHERIHMAVRRLPDGVFNLGEPFIPPCVLSERVHRQELIQRLERDLKYLTLEKREQLLQRLEAQAGSAANLVPTMTMQQLRDLHSQGFGIGAHTTLHPILNYCSNEQIDDEIGGARERIEGIIGGTIEGFAYPNGRPFADFSRLHVDAVKRAGYKFAVTTHWGASTQVTSPFQIPRFTPWAEREWHITYQLMRNLATRPLHVPEGAA